MKKNILLITLFLIMTTACMAWEKAQIFSNSKDIPGAEGTVKFEKTDNDNIQVKLKVKHLAHPENLNPAASVYVVWVTDNKEYALPHNIGALIVDKNLNGTLETTTPMHNFEIFITGEKSGQVDNPAGAKLLWALRSEGEKK